MLLLLHTLLFHKFHQALSVFPFSDNDKCLLKLGPHTAQRAGTVVSVLPAAISSSQQQQQQQ